MLDFITKEPINKGWSGDKLFENADFITSIIRRGFLWQKKR